MFQKKIFDWFLKEVEVEYLGTNTLTPTGDVPSGEDNFLRKPDKFKLNLLILVLAPINISYACNGTFLFEKDGISLQLQNIQV